MEKLFWSLFNAHTEDEVDNIVNMDPLLFNPNNWIPYDGNKGNFGTFEGQQNNPIPALIEKITNSIDALLLKKCKLKGINPKSVEAPQNMSDAVELFYNIKNGDFSEVSSGMRREIAENIQIIATGDKETPSLLIYDNGEGQHPEDFQDTFLSLHRNNKIGIRFVQGKYNMGSTGAVIFCGEKKYQLIGSRKNIELSETDAKLGFTLVRRHPLTTEEELSAGVSYYEYFCPSGSIPSFNTNGINLGLHNRNFISGSIVKLYSYQLPRGAKSDITLDLWRNLNQFLYHPALPILLFEAREYGSSLREKGRTPTKPLLGNKTRISLDDRDSVQKIVPFSIEEPSKFGIIPIEVIVFNSNVEHKEFIKNKSVIFTVNGQSHASLGKTFISKDLGFSLLKDSLLIHIDCTNIKTGYRQDLFMSNRTQLKEGPKTQYILDKIEQIIKKSEVLKQLNQERKNSILRENKDDKELIETIISKLPVDKDLTNLLKKDGNLQFLKKLGDQIESKQNSKSTDNSKSKKLDRFPAIFNIKLKERGNRLIKTIPINNHGKVEFETDVQDDYLFRPSEQGDLDITILNQQRTGDLPPTEPTIPDLEGDKITVEREGPVNGTIKLIISPTENAKIGDEIEVETTLTAPGKDLKCIFYVKISEPIQINSQEKRTKNETLPQLPKPQKVFKEKSNESEVDWDDMNWDGNDIVKIIEDCNDGNNLIQGIAINMDSFALQRFISKNRIMKESDIKFIKDKYFLAIYLHSLFLYGIFDKMSKNGFSEQFKDIDISEILTNLFKPYSAFLLYENYHFEKNYLDDED